MQDETCMSSHKVLNLKCQSDGEIATRQNCKLNLLWEVIHTHFFPFAALWIKDSHEPTLFRKDLSFITLGTLGEQNILEIQF